MIQKFRDNTFLEEDKTIILPPSKQKSDHYSLENREKEKHSFPGGLVREGGNASLVVGVTRAVYKRAHPQSYAFRRMRGEPGCCDRQLSPSAGTAESATADITVLL